MVRILDGLEESLARKIRLGMQLYNSKLVTKRRRRGHRRRRRRRRKRRELSPPFIEQQPASVPFDRPAPQQEPVPSVEEGEGEGGDHTLPTRQVAAARISRFLKRHVVLPVKEGSESDLGKRSDKEVIFAVTVESPKEAIVVDRISHGVVLSSRNKPNPNPSDNADDDYLSLGSSHSVMEENCLEPMGYELDSQRSSRSSTPSSRSSQHPSTTALQRTVDDTDPSNSGHSGTRKVDYFPSNKVMSGSSTFDPFLAPIDLGMNRDNKVNGYTSPFDDSCHDDLDEGGVPLERERERARSPLSSPRDEGHYEVDTAIGLEHLYSKANAIMTLVEDMRVTLQNKLTEVIVEKLSASGESDELKNMKLKKEKEHMDRKKEGIAISATRMTEDIGWIVEYLLNENCAKGREEGSEGHHHHHSVTVERGSHVPTKTAVRRPVKTVKSQSQSKRSDSYSHSHGRPHYRVVGGGIVDSYGFYIPGSQVRKVVSASTHTRERVAAPIAAPKKQELQNESRSTSVRDKPIENIEFFADKLQRPLMEVPARSEPPSLEYCITGHSLLARKEDHHRIQSLADTATSSKRAAASQNERLRAIMSRFPIEDMKYKLNNAARSLLSTMQLTLKTILLDGHLIRNSSNEAAESARRQSKESDRGGLSAASSVKSIHLAPQRGGSLWGESLLSESFAQSREGYSDLAATSSEGFYTDRSIEGVQMTEENSVEWRERLDFDNMTYFPEDSTNSFASIPSIHVPQEELNEESPLSGSQSVNKEDKASHEKNRTPPPREGNQLPKRAIAHTTAGGKGLYIIAQSHPAMEQCQRKERKVHSSSLKKSPFDDASHILLHNKPFNGFLSRPAASYPRNRRPKQTVEDSSRCAQRKTDFGAERDPYALLEEDLARVFSSLHESESEAEAEATHSPQVAVEPPASASRGIIPATVDSTPPSPDERARSVRRSGGEKAPKVHLPIMVPTATPEARTVAFDDDIADSMHEHGEGPPITITCSSHSHDSMNDDASHLLFDTHMLRNLRPPSPVARGEWKGESSSPNDATNLHSLGGGEWQPALVGENYLSLYYSGEEEEGEEEKEHAKLIMDSTAEKANAVRKLTLPRIIPQGEGRPPEVTPLDSFLEILRKDVRTSSPQSVQVKQTQTASLPQRRKLSQPGTLAGPIRSALPSPSAISIPGKKPEPPAAMALVGHSPLKSSAFRKLIQN